MFNKLLQIYISVKTFFNKIFAKLYNIQRSFILKYFRKYRRFQRKFYKFMFRNLRKNYNNEGYFRKEKEEFLVLKFCIFFLILIYFFIYIYIGYSVYLDVMDRYTLKPFPKEYLNIIQSNKEWYQSNNKGL